MEEQIENLDNKYQDGVELMEQPEVAPPPKKGLLKLKCSCGEVSNISDEVIEHGLSWTMLIGNDHYLMLSCPACRHSMTMLIDEIDNKDELQEESNEK